MFSTEVAQSSDVKDITLQSRNVRRLLLSLVLLVSASYLFAILRAKAIWVDEVLTFYTVRGRSLVDLWSFQASSPLVLEPPTNDLIVWFSTHLLGYSTLALRLPALLFYLGLQYMLYLAAKAIGGYRAGFMAAVLGLSVYAVTYCAEPRPYALLMAMSVFALISWRSFHVTTNLVHRRAAAFGIALALAVAITCNFFGFLCVLPVVAAEVALSVMQRKLPGWKMVFALAAASSAVLIDLPFIRASSAYGKYSLGAPLPLYQQILQIYDWCIMQPPGLIRRLPWTSPHLPMVTLLLCSLVLSFPKPDDRFAGSLSQFKLRRAFWVGSVMLMLTAVPASAVIYYVTHVNSPRHGIACVPGVLILASVAAARILHRANWGMLTAAVLCLLLLVVERTHRMLLDQNITRRVTLASYEVSPAVRELLANRGATQKVYLTLDECMLFPFYGDQRDSTRIRCVISLPREIQYNHQVVGYLTAQAFAKHTDFPFPMVSYEEFQADPDPLLAFDAVPWDNWIVESLAADHTHTQRIGIGFGGEVTQVHFPNH